MEAGTPGRTIANRVRLRWPSLPVKLDEFPSGAFMLDLELSGETYVVEYLPSFGKYGLSRLSTASYGWEGFEEEFSDVEHLFERLGDLVAGETGHV
jgi:hypothetical protein